MHSDPSVDLPASDRALDAGLAAAFGADSGPPLPAGASVLKALGALLPEIRWVQLREPAAETVAPAPSPPSEGVTSDLGSAGRYRIDGEIARGGMGAVLKGRDTDLGRDIVVKVLLETHQGKTELVQRFVEEAQIGGQLQHPGVVPVYELGQFPDKRPYFTMKLVKGRTLATLLAERKDPAEDRPRFLKIFEQVCQTVAYSHARGVLHRDLKPANVMVGAFGEVQVMDWGLAKVLREGGDDAGASRECQPPEALSVIRTRRSEATGPAGPQTQVGSVLGTPAYTAPEQARGAVERLDERADVFGLGAIQCEILTGKPPYVAGQADQLFCMAVMADLDEAFARLDACGADADLIQLARRCLAAKPEERPRHAGVLAAEVTTYLESVEARLRQAELAGAEARARAREERKRRKLTVALAAAGLALVVIGGGGAAWWWQARAELVRDVEAALAEARGHQEAGRWPEARAAFDRAEGRLAGSGPPALRDRVRQARADANLVAELDEILLRQAEGKKGAFDIAGADARYAEAFREYGLDVMAVEAAEAAAGVRASAIRSKLLAALDDWMRVRVRQDADVARLRAVADAVDESAWRRSFRDAVLSHDAARMKALAGQAEALVQPPVVLDWLGNALANAGLTEEALALFGEAHRRYPDDFWINYSLGALLTWDLRPPRPAEAVGYFRAAVALRPGSSPVRDSLGAALHNKGDLEGASAEYHQALALDPNDAWAHNNLSLVLKDKGDFDGAITQIRKALALEPKDALAQSNLGVILHAKKDREGALAAYRQAVGLDPKFAAPHGGLGDVLYDKEDFDGAVAEYRRAIDLDPKDARTHYNLGNVLLRKQNLEGALGEYCRAIALDPKDARIHCALGDALLGRENWEDALTEFRQALTLAPKYAAAQTGVGLALHGKKDLNGALDAYRRALDLDPKDAWTHYNLGNTLHENKDLKGAIDVYRQAVKLDPKLAAAYASLGLALCDAKDPEGAIDACRQAVTLNPKDARAYSYLGYALSDANDRKGAIEAYRGAVALDPKLAAAYAGLGAALYAEKDLQGASAAYRRALDLEPKDARTHAGLARVLQDMKNLKDAITEYQKALSCDRNLVGAHTGLASALWEKGDRDGVIAECREALVLDPTDTWAHRALGLALYEKKDWDGAISAYRLALGLEPNDAATHHNLALALEEKGDLDAAITEYRRALDLDPERPETRSRLAVAWVGRLLERGVYLRTLERQLPAILAGQSRPATPAESLEYARLCSWKGLPAGSARLYVDAFTADPKLADDPRAAHRYRAACSAALAGCGRGGDADRLGDRERAGWRRLALDWMRADLAGRARQLEGGKPEHHKQVQDQLRRWLRDPDLAGIRDADAVMRLPAEERDACRRLWADVAALLAKAEPKK
jgi:serine/threonine-protein kinase